MNKSITLPLATLFMVFLGVMSAYFKTPAFSFVMLPALSVFLGAAIGASLPKDCPICYCSKCQGGAYLAKQNPSKFVDAHK